MHRIAFVASSIVLASLVASACSSSTPTTDEEVVSASMRGKPGAPVTVSAVLGRGTARVTVRFDADASDAHVRVHGVDGLVVTSAATPIDGGVFTHGATQTFDVAFTPGAARSHLVVSVSGDFQGASQSRVASFAVGQASARTSVGATTTDGSGERVQLIPVGGR